MDGKELRRRLQQLLNEDSDSGWLDERSTYDFLYEAAIDFTDRTHCLKSSQEITTVEDQTDYNLDPAYLKLYVTDGNNNYVVKWGDNTFISWEDYGDMVYSNQTDSVSIPNTFTIVDADLPSQITGTATSTTASTGGISLLNDTAGDFTTVSPGSTIHNTTDGSTGIITSKTSTTIIATSLFGGTNNFWESSDAYVIQPQGRMKLVLNPPPDSAETVTVNFIERPNPVYGDYQAYRFQDQYGIALVKYAFWLYKYRDMEPNFGDAMYKYWDNAVRKAGYSTNQSLNRKVGISFKGKR